MNKIAINKAMNNTTEPYDELSDEELEKIFDEKCPDVDLIKLEKEIQTEKLPYIY